MPFPSVSVIFILIAVSLLVALGFLGLFLWSIRAGQYDDEYTPSVRILFDDEVNVVEESKEFTKTQDARNELRDTRKNPRNRKHVTRNPLTRNP